MQPPVSNLTAAPNGALLTHPGTQYSHALALALARQQQLSRFATGLAWGHEWQRWLPASWRSRVVPGLPDRLLYRCWQPELRLLLTGRRRSLTPEDFFRRNQAFQQALPQRLLQQCGAVIGFDTSSWLLQQRARAAGKPFVLDASIAHPLAKEAVYQQLRSEFPDWATHSESKAQALLALEQQEMEQADRIVVASSFTRDTYLQHGVPAHKIVVNPYGTDLQFFESKWNQPLPVEGPVRFVFMGSIGARKGVPWLCRVWPQLLAQVPQAQLTLAGYGQWPASVPLPPQVQLAGAIAPSHRAAFLRQHHVFVFPSYFEGFAQVIIEAMACGLPVITTTATAAPDVMTAGEDGFILTPGDDAALLQALLHFALQPAEVERMGRQAALHVQPYTWQAYGQRWATLLQSLTGA